MVDAALLRPFAVPGASRRPIDAPVGLAIAVGIALGLVVGASSHPARIALLVIAAIVGLAITVAAPRLVLVVGLFALVSYVPDVVGQGTFALVATGLPVLLAAAVVVRHVTGIERVALPTETKWFLLFGVALLAAFAGAGDRSLALGEYTDYLGFAVLAVVTIVLVGSRDLLRRAMWAVVAALAVLAALAVYQQLTRDYGQTFGGLATVTPDRDALRSNGPLSANYFAQVLAAGAPLAWYLGLHARARAERFAAFAAFAAVGVMLWALAYTLSRGALVAVVVAAFLIAALRGLSLRRIVVLAAVVTAAAVVFLPSTMKERVGEVAGATAGSQASDSSVRGRLGENLAALDMFRDHPLLGVGLDNFEIEYSSYAQRVAVDFRPEARAAHSLYLEALAETGVLGTFGLLALLLAALGAGWRARTRATGNDRLLGEGCFVALVAFLVCAATLHLTYPRYLWVFVALAFAAGRVTGGARA
jgi:O-antigen ligase